MDESEDIKVKNTEMEQLRINFDADQKKCFKDQEKKISEKIEAKMDNLTIAMGTKLQTHQDTLMEIIKAQDTFMKENLSCIFSTMVNLKETTKGHQV
eukprot:5013568-Ditylum_brightwellii.AAC.1